MELDQLHENCTGRNGESPEGHQMKPNGSSTFSKIPRARLLRWQPDKWLGLLQAFEITFAGRYIDGSVH